MFIVPEPLTAAVMLLRVTLAEPDTVMLPTELRFPVGATLVPPDIESVVPADSAAAPEYAPDGEMVSEELEVTFFARVTVLPVDVSETEPPVDSIVPLVAFDSAPEPE
jgi:hypothetical protein